MPEKEFFEPQKMIVSEEETVEEKKTAIDRVLEFFTAEGISKGLVEADGGAGLDIKKVISRLASLITSQNDSVSLNAIKYLNDILKDSLVLSGNVQKLTTTATRQLPDGTKVVQDLQGLKVMKEESQQTMKVLEMAPKHAVIDMTPELEEKQNATRPSSDICSKRTDGDTESKQHDGPDAGKPTEENPSDESLRARAIEKWDGPVQGAVGDGERIQNDLSDSTRNGQSFGEVLNGIFSSERVGQSELANTPPVPTDKDIDDFVRDFRAEKEAGSKGEGTENMEEEETGKGGGVCSEDIGNGGDDTLIGNEHGHKPPSDTYAKGLCGPSQ